MSPIPRISSSPVSPRGNGFPSRTADYPLAVARRPADTAGADKLVVVLFGHPDVATGFGHAERLEPRYAPTCFEFGVQLAGDRRRADRAHVVLPVLGCFR